MLTHIYQGAGRNKTFKLTCSLVACASALAFTLALARALTKIC